jgi:hypothetical protein
MNQKESAHAVMHKGGERWIVREHRGVHKVGDSPGTSVIQ